MRKTRKHISRRRKSTRKRHVQKQHRGGDFHVGNLLRKEGISPKNTGILPPSPYTRSVSSPPPAPLVPKKSLVNRLTPSATTKQRVTNAKRTVGRVVGNAATVVANMFSSAASLVP
jgi:hypothetical protein